LAYVADLELEVDRLRKQGQFLRHEAREALKRILGLCEGPATGATHLAEVASAARDLAEVLRDLHEPPGYHPAHDQVVAIAVRPLVEQAFRWQQRLTRNREVALRLDLEVEHVEWFPARLRHILDNLLSNALRYRDPVKAESWVHVGLRASDGAYEFHVSDNGMGLPDQDRRAFELLSRAAPVRAAGLGVGLPVVRLLVEQSGGTLSVRSEQGRGTDFVLTLPRYDLDDYLT
jgi:signal transduction histidine kinase